MHLNIAPLQRCWAHSQIWHTGVHILPRDGRYLIPPDPSNRLFPHWTMLLCRGLQVPLHLKASKKPFGKSLSAETAEGILRLEGCQDRFRPLPGVSSVGFPGKDGRSCTNPLPRLKALFPSSVIVGRVQTFKMLNIAQEIRRIGQIFGQILKFLKGGELID